MEIMVVVIIVIAVVIASRMKAAGQEKQARQERLQQQERTRMTSHYTPAAPEAQVPGQIHLSDVLPDQKPPAAPSARMPFTPTEGVAFHPPGFHGDSKPHTSGLMEKKPLEKADLGAERARQNAHTADNANWTAPKETQVQDVKAARRPMYTAKQLRDAFIMQEIIDVPVSRRKESRRGYGS